MLHINLLPRSVITTATLSRTLGVFPRCFGNKPVPNSTGSGNEGKRNTGGVLERNDIAKPKLFTMKRSISVSASKGHQTTEQNCQQFTGQPPSRPKVDIYTDASHLGTSAFYNGKWFFYPWPETHLPQGFELKATPDRTLPGTNKVRTNSTSFMHMKIYTDASRLGAGAYLSSCGKWCFYPWPMSVKSSNLGMGWMEFFIIVVAARLWGLHLSGCGVMFLTDSESSAVAWRNGSFNSPEINKLMDSLKEEAIQNKFNPDISYIPRSENTVADLISRNQIVDVRRMIPGIDTYPTPIPSNVVQDLLPE